MPSVFPSLQGGEAAPSKKWSRSEKARTGWSLASNASKCVLKHLRVSDHPVCGASGASRLLFDAAATPPLQGGEFASPKLLDIFSQLHRPRLLQFSLILFSSNRRILMLTSGSLNVVAGFSPRSGNGLLF
jgi:hypothetical protein